MYTTQRGRQSETRPYGTTSIDDRRAILTDYLKLGTAETMKKWNLSYNTLHHIKYHHKWLLQEIEEQNLKQMGL